MPLSTEELLATRYKLIADYPHNKYYSVGEIFKHNQIGKETQLPYYKYPHLFQKLAWYEERKITDMPEYVKDTSTDNYHKVMEHTYDAGEYWGVKVYHNDMVRSIYRHSLLPISMEEYNQNKK